METEPIVIVEPSTITPEPVSEPESKPEPESVVTTDSNTTAELDITEEVPLSPVIIDDIQPVDSDDDLDDFLENYKSVYNSIKKMKLTDGNYMLVIMKVMNEVEKLKELNGSEKKDLSIRILLKLLKDLKIDDNVKIVLETIFTYNSLSSIIDSLVSASRGKMNINVKKLKTKLFKFCKC